MCGVRVTPSPIVNTRGGGVPSIYLSRGLLDTLLRVEHTVASDLSNMGADPLTTVYRYASQLYHGIYNCLPLVDIIIDRHNHLRFRKLINFNGFIYS